jgi:hypothetical protein
MGRRVRSLESRTEARFQYMRAQKEYCRIAMLKTRNERALEVSRLEKDLTFNISERREFNRIAWDGKLHTPQIQEF